MGKTKAVYQLKTMITSIGSGAIIKEQLEPAAYKRKSGIIERLSKSMIGHRSDGVVCYTELGAICPIPDNIVTVADAFMFISKERIYSIRFNSKSYRNASKWEQIEKLPLIS